MSVAAEREYKALLTRVITGPAFTAEDWDRLSEKDADHAANLLAKLELRHMEAIRRMRIRRAAKQAEARRAQGVSRV